VAALRAVAHTISYHGRVMGDTQSGDPAALHRLAPVDVAALAVAGGESPAQQRDAVVALCSVLPHAQLRIVAGQGHQFDPATVAPHVAAFLE
jgi:hypothetical protein